MIDVEKLLDYLDQAPSPAKPVSQEAYGQLAQNDAHHLKIVCGLGPDLTTLLIPAAAVHL